MVRQINPFQDNEFLELGRLIHDDSYRREKHEILVDNMKYDMIKKGNDSYIIAEIKKTSKYEKAALMQLSYYLYRLYQKGLILKGQLLIPREKKKIEVVLDDSIIKEIETVVNNIYKIIFESSPPKLKKIPFCKNCAYQDLCWS